jgi:hypothetical protein
VSRLGLGYIATRIVAWYLDWLVYWHCVVVALLWCLPARIYQAFDIHPLNWFVKYTSCRSLVLGSIDIEMLMLLIKFREIIGTPITSRSPLTF